jgi:hypothetical protein
MPLPPPLLQPLTRVPRMLELGVQGCWVALFFDDLERGGTTAKLVGGGGLRGGALETSPTGAHCLKDTPGGG